LNRVLLQGGGQKIREDLDIPVAKLNTESEYLNGYLSIKLTYCSLIAKDAAGAGQAVSASGECQERRTAIPSLLRPAPQFMHVTCPRRVPAHAKRHRTPSN
jgi:hypothetical protein